MLSWCRCLLFWGGLLTLFTTSCAPRQGVFFDEAIAPQLGLEAPLLPLYRALAFNSNVVILQIGDSHTANDSFSARMRELFQAQFGDAGLGVLPPGVPSGGYRPARLSVTQEGWSVVSSTDPDAAGPFGITGLRQHAGGAATMALTVDDSNELADVEIELLRQPRGGTVFAALEHGSRAAISTNAPTQNAAWQPVPPAPGSHTLDVEALGDGPVDMLAWSITRSRPGVVYANLGRVGRWDPTIVRQELEHLNPSAIVLTFGTDAGFRDNIDVAAYGKNLAARLRQLHAASPQAALLVLGPPDAYRRRPRHSAVPVACDNSEWTEPPNLDPIRQTERAVAPRENVYFWDWQAAMGGPCSMLRWALTKPPMAASDREHLLASGYRASAEALFRTIMNGYERYQQALRPTS
jgi:lysophospholipase L1-like esterase